MRNLTVGHLPTKYEKRIESKLLFYSPLHTFYLGFSHSVLLIIIIITIIMVDGLNYTILQCNRLQRCSYYCVADDRIIE